MGQNLLTHSYVPYIAAHDVTSTGWDTLTYLVVTINASMTG